MLINFIQEYTISREEEPSFELEAEELVECWVLHINGSSSTARSVAKLTLTSSEGVVMEYALCFKFETSNNKAEYKTLVARLKIAKELGV